MPPILVGFIANGAGAEPPYPPPGYGEAEAGPQTGGKL